MKKSDNSVTVYLSILTFLLIMISAIPACTGNRNNNMQETSKEDSTNGKAQMVDSVKLKLSDNDTVFVIAGKSIGRFELNQEVEQAQLFEILGKADSGDAAMCKSWSMWYLSNNPSKEELDVYSACDPAVDMRKTIQILRLSNVDFITENGVSSASTRMQLKEAYPNAAIIEDIKSSSSEKIMLVDDVASGITFELKDNKITAVSIHKVGEKITDTYLPFYEQD